jgi:methylase of polypeptide subunit release factors
VDLIFTDPPYLASTLDSYDVLAGQAPRILKPGGFLYAYVGAEFLPQALSSLKRADGLDWFWLYNVRHRRTPRMWSKRLFVSSKPVLAFTRGHVRMADLSWMRSDYEKDHESKAYHEWGQGDGFARYIIERRTKPGQVVLDPFCGGGAFLRAGKDCGRSVLGIDIDPEAIRATNERLAQESLDMGERYPATAEQGVLLEKGIENA